MSTESLIELGKKLVLEFKLEDKTDTLSQWMLHYLAELFERYDLSTSPEEKRTVSVDIRDTIFKLWEFRYEQAHSQSSFKNIESLVSTLKKLNLDNDDYFYTPLRNYRDTEKNKNQTSPEYWYNYALELDKASRLLIRNCILKGYALNEKDNEEVAKLIEQLEALDAYETLFSKFYSEQSTHDKEQRNITQNISKIDELINALTELKSAYEEKLTS
ncbi:hypothetical protein CDG62_11570 [Acinetobacter sp. WCHA55]|uniref:hypothetical protein n=1 Tax=Acinetobacter sp. WCHA55 TaxID=2004646 RepID=UPI000B3BFD03|nr:hypothetical protein [Acinetobacter sp. WCHA55]AYA68934.1 hypothetical protein CDG62_11570 [Acinetobacter sp. WCHA55]